MSLASVPLITHVAHAQFTPTEGLSLGIAYGWYNGGNTVEVNVANTGTTVVTIAATSINNVNCSNFSGSNGLELDPGNSTTLTITYQNNVFQLGNTYTIQVVTAENNAFYTEGVVENVAPAVGATGTITVGTEPEGVAYDSGKGEVFVANYAAGTVSVISDSNNAVVATVTVGANPYGVAYDSGKGEVFVADTSDNTVSVISDSAVIPEFQPFMLLPLFMIITLLGAIILKNKRNAKVTAGRLRDNNQ